MATGRARCIEKGGSIDPAWRSGPWSGRDTTGVGRRATAPVASPPTPCGTLALSGGVALPWPRQLEVRRLFSGCCSSSEEAQRGRPLRPTGAVPAVSCRRLSPYCQRPSLAGRRASSDKGIAPLRVSGPGAGAALIPPAGGSFGERPNSQPPSLSRRAAVDSPVAVRGLQDTSTALIGRPLVAQEAGTHLGAWLLQNRTPALQAPAGRTSQSNPHPRQPTPRLKIALLPRPSIIVCGARGGSRRKPHKPGR